MQMARVDGTRWMLMLFSLQKIEAQHWRNATFIFFCLLCDYKASKTCYKWGHVNLGVDNWKLGVSEIKKEDSRNRLKQTGFKN